MRHVSRQEVIGHLVKLLNALDVCADDSLLFFEDSDVTVHFSVAELIIIEVPQRCRHLVLALVVEDDVERASVVIDFELSAHRFLNSTKKSAHKDDVIDRISIKLANVIWARLRVHDHSHCNWREDLLLPRLHAHVSPATLVSICAWSGWRHLLTLIHIKESLCLICEHSNLFYSKRGR